MLILKWECSTETDLPTLRSVLPHLLEQRSKNKTKCMNFALSIFPHLNSKKEKKKTLGANIWLSLSLLSNDQMFKCKFPNKSCYLSCPQHRMCVCVPYIYQIYSTYMYAHIYIYSIYTVLDTVLMDKHIFNNMTVDTVVCSEKW